MSCSKTESYSDSFTNNGRKGDYRVVCSMFGCNIY